MAMRTESVFMQIFWLKRNLRLQDSAPFFSA